MITFKSQVKIIKSIKNIKIDFILNQQDKENIKMFLTLNKKNRINFYILLDTFLKEYIINNKII